MPLTDTKLRALYGKPYFGKTELSDRDGLSARVTERGTISWQYRYRWQGKAARLKIGRYPDLKLADARALIPAIRGALERNEHPRVFWDKLHQKHDVTLKQCCEHFREHHLPKLRPRTVMLYEHTMQRYFEPLFIGIPVEQIPFSSWLEWFDKICPVLNPTCKSDYGPATVLLYEKVIAVRDSYGPNFGIKAPPLWDGICNNEQDIQDLTFAVHSSGADMWITTKGGPDGKFDGMASAGPDFWVSRYDTTPDTYAHEAFHLFGAEDLYNRKGAEGFCDQGCIWAGRLMCGYGDLTKNNMFGGSPSAIEQGDIYPYGPSERYLLQNFYNNPDSPDAARLLTMPDGNLRAC
ncbi:MULTISPECIES: integrase arm-type DNA-binding domain-containing protein [Aeromonas]|uniref:integrase arm-type DNA-binding domain-containing protein n=1 Tax=Aeromonas TaxID=642 RepID=UPI000B296A85|nr:MULTISPECIES: integrase arm-type DNA-binding domain-containing protein [Aeromonas]